MATRSSAGHAARRADRPALVKAIGEVSVRQGISRAERIRTERPSSLANGSTICEPESIDTHELVWERYANDWLRTSVSTYWYKAERLITLVADDSRFLACTFVNQGEVRAKGLELEAQMRLRGRIAGVGELCAAKRGGARDARWAAELADTYRQGANQRAWSDGSVLHIHRGTVSQQPGDACRPEGVGAAIFNITMVQPLGRSLELFGSVRNIFDAQYSDPVSAQHPQDPSSRTAERLGSDFAGSCGPISPQAPSNCREVLAGLKHNQRRRCRSGSVSRRMARIAARSASLTVAKSVPRSRPVSTSCSRWDM